MSWLLNDLRKRVNETMATFDPSHQPETDTVTQKSEEETPVVAEKVTEKKESTEAVTSEAGTVPAETSVGGLISEDMQQKGYAFASKLFDYAKESTVYAGKSLEVVKNAVEKHTMIGELNQDLATFEKELEEKKMKPVRVPWEGLSDESLAKKQILSLSLDTRNFLRDSPGASEFSPDEQEAMAVFLVENDPNLSKVRFQLVPKQLSETKFWQNYFYRVSLIRQSMGAMSEAEKQSTATETQSNERVETTVEKAEEPIASSSTETAAEPEKPSKKEETQTTPAKEAEKDSVEDFRKRSGTGSSSGGRRWGRKDTSAQLELRCCINPDILRSNVDKHSFFEDEQVRVNGSVFYKRENYDNLLATVPQAKFNGIHIKMEDDCPQGGDDVRLCLLKTLGAHNQREVPCISCHKQMKVYDKYPLIDGTFFLSPVVHYGPHIEVMYEGKRLNLQQLCVSCLWSDWKCNNCGRDGWFSGKSLILGTLYYYDIISSGTCCPPTCTMCRSPLLIPENMIQQIVNGNFRLLHELISCSACGCKNFHCIRHMGEVLVMPP